MNDQQIIGALDTVKLTLRTIKETTDDGEVEVISTKDYESMIEILNRVMKDLKTKNVH